MSAEPLLEVDGLTKSFKGVRALDAVGFDLRLGEVLGLAGHNGAGKSTLLNILSGVVTADGGSMRLDGRKYAPASYSAAMRSGIFRIYQELSVLGNLTVAENLTLGSEKQIRTAGLLSPRRAITTTEQFLADLGLDELSPRRRVDTLSLAERQLLEIAKTLYRARLENIARPVLLLDEPTSGLTSQQVDFLEGHINNLRSQMGIILTTHRGSELLEWSDRVVVLRDGQVVARRDPRATTAEGLARLMVGDTPPAKHTRQERPAHAQEPVLEVDRLLTPKLAEPVSFAVGSGEVVALVGESQEKTDIVRSISGLMKPLAGRVSVHQRAMRPSVRAAMSAGVRFVPADRGGEGLSLLQSVKTNLSLAAIASEGQADLARRPKAEDRFASSLVQKYRVKVADLDQPSGSLSGGNQQKLLVARAMSDSAKVIVLDRPTRGIDVHAKSEIFRLILEASAKGVAVLVATDEPEEILSICDRVIAFKDGRISAEFNCTDGNEPALAELGEAIS